MTKVKINLLGNQHYSKEHRVELKRNNELVEMTAIIADAETGVALNNSVLTITMNKAGARRLKNSLNVLLNDW
jgi:hypothetical protein